MARPQTIQIFLPDGNPQGIRRAEITTRTVQVFDVPRALLSDFLASEAAAQVGLYVLFGEADELPTCYVGESDAVGQRLRNHNTKKDFWNRVLVAISTSKAWTKTHVRYLEVEAIRRAKESGRYDVQNLNEGGVHAFTPEPIEADCEEYLETISTLCATLGFPFLRKVQDKAETKKTAIVYLTQRNCDASGTYTGEGFVVFEGSVCRSDEPDPMGTGRTMTPTKSTVHMEPRRQRLLEEGVLVYVEGKLVFAADHLFDSPSGAAGVVSGAPMNGWDVWRDDAGRTLDLIEERGAATPVSEGEA